MAATCVTTVLNTLTNACSQNPDLLKIAEEQIKTLEIQPGYHKALMCIYKSYDLNPNVRWLAVVCLKNGVDRYWRSTAPNAMNDDEKNEIKTELLTVFEEPIAQIALQIAVLIAKVFRIDAKQWTILIPTLFQELQHPEFLHRQRSLIIFHQVVKMMASKKLFIDKQNFQELSTNAFSFVFKTWDNYHISVITEINGNNSISNEAIQVCYLTSKILKKILIHGYKAFYTNSEQMDFIKKAMQFAKQLLDIRYKLIINESLVEQLEKLIVILCKAIQSSQEYHALSCVPILPDLLQFSSFFAFTNCQSKLVFEMVLLHCSNLMKNIIRCESYKPLNKNTEPSDPLIIESHKFLKEFFTAPVLTEIINTLVSHYFILSKEDLDLWDSDPEEYDNEEAGESWRYQLRPSTEALLLGLFKEFSPIVTPIIVSLINYTREIPETNNVQVLLQKEAVYNVAGLCSYDLFEDIDFENWFSQNLIAEVKNKSPNNRIIRRRIVWLVGQWINVKLSATYRPMLYAFLQDLLNETEDLVVRLNAAKTLRIAIDDFDFRSEDFIMYLEKSFSLLFKLLLDVKECDTKMHVLFVMSLLIERVGQKIKPFASVLTSYLPHLWQDSEEHNMLKCSILSTMVNLVRAIGSESSCLYQFLLPAIQVSTDVSQPCHVYLLEDGLELWSITLKYSSTMTSEVLQLFNNIPHLLELSSENLRTTFLIIESYVLLGGMQFLVIWSDLISTTCHKLLGTLRPEGSIILARIIETIFRCFPIEGPKMFETILPKLFDSIIDGKEYGPLLAVYISLFSVLLLKNSSFFYSFLDQMASHYQNSSEQLLSKFLDAWLQRMDSINKPERRKLAALSLLSLYSAKQKVFFDHFAVIIEVIVDILHELNKSYCPNSDCLLIDPNENVCDEDITSEHLRRRQIDLKDPVYTVNLGNYVRDLLQQCQKLYGSQTFQMMLSSVDASLIKEIEGFLNTN